MSLAATLAILGAITTALVAGERVFQALTLAAQAVAQVLREVPRNRAGRRH